MANKLASLVISIYISALIYSNAFFMQILTVADSEGQLFWNHLAIFLILLVPIYFLVSRYVSMPYSRGSMKHIRAFVVGIALVGLSLAMLYHIIPLEPIYNLPPYVDQVFASDTAFTIWLIIPLLALFI